MKYENAMVWYQIFNVSSIKEDINISDVYVYVHISSKMTLMYIVYLYVDICIWCQMCDVTSVRGE